MFAPILVTSPRLWLKPMTIDSARALEALCSDEVFEFLPEEMRPSDPEIWLARRLLTYRPKLLHAITLRVSEEPIGCMEVLSGADRTNLFLVASFWLGPDHWGQGYATEALATTLMHLPYAQVPRVFAATAPSNRRAIRVLEKCGFRGAYGPNVASVGAVQPDAQWYRWRQLQYA